MPKHRAGVLIMRAGFEGEITDAVTGPDMAGAVSIDRYRDQPFAGAGAAGADHRLAADAGLPDLARRSRRALEPGRQQPVALLAIAAGAAGRGRDGVRQGHRCRLLGYRRRTGAVTGDRHGLCRCADAADGQAQGEASMTFDWQGAWTAVIHHPLFGIGITLGAYQLVLAAFEKTRWILLQPVLVSMLLDRRIAQLWPDLRRVPQKHRDHGYSARPGDRGPGCAAVTEPAADPPIVLADFYYAGGRWRVGHRPVCAAGLVVWR